MLVLVMVSNLFRVLAQEQLSAQCETNYYYLFQEIRHYEGKEFNELFILRRYIDRSWPISDKAVTKSKLRRILKDIFTIFDGENVPLNCHESSSHLQGYPDVTITLLKR